MRHPISLILSLAYMSSLALFLSFAAMWVCDGYYPVGWGWKGASLHLVFWAMPLSLIVGSVVAYGATRPRIAAILLLIGSAPFVAGILWVELEMALSSALKTQSSWLHVRLLAAVLAILADVILIRWSKGGSRKASHVMDP